MLTSPSLSGIHSNSSSSSAVAERLAKDGVVCLAGRYFGEGQDRYLRLAFANADADSDRASPRAAGVMLQCPIR